MGKRGDKLRQHEDVYWESDGQNINIEDTQSIRQDRGEQPTQYEAPGDRKWKARNLVTIHWNILNYPCPYPSMVHIFACVIDHANINTGRCDAGQKVMAIETNYSTKTVRKVLEWIADNTPFLRIERRTGIKGQFRSNAYHVQWQHLEVDWIGIQCAIEDAKQEHRDASQSSTMGTQGFPRKGNSRVPTVHGNSRVPTNHEYIKHEEEPRHEVVRPPSVADTQVISSSSEGKEEKGNQGEQVERQSPPQQPHAEPQIITVNFWTRRATAAKAELQTCTDPDRREQLEATIERARSYIK